MIIVTCPKSFAVVRAHRTRATHGGIAELPLALYCFLLVIVFPLIDLLGLATGSTIVYLSTNEASTRAANQRRYSDSLNGMLQAAQQFTQTGFASFAKLAPIGGYENSGADLFIDANNTKSNSTQSYGPNTDITQPIDQSTYVYEARVHSAFEVGPLINLGFLPLLKNAPGIGKPAIINFSASKQIEFPTGLLAANPSASNGPWPSFNTSESPTAASQDGGSFQSGWNMPGIYTAINSAGQTTVSESVVVIQATNFNPTDTGVNVQANQHLWLDLRSNGLWTTGTSSNGSVTLWDANGIPAADNSPTAWNGQNQAPFPSGNIAELVGRIGTNPYFGVGLTFTNYTPNQSGEFELIMNDNYYAPNTPTVYGTGYADNIGSQVVRVILTR